MEVETQVRFIVPCPRCGPQWLRCSAFHLTVFDTGSASTLAFFCPACTDEVQYLVDDRAAQTLMDEGVAATGTHVPTEVLEHPPAHCPPITPDDVMDFIVGLRHLVAP